MKQHTLKQKTEIKGIGLHSGVEVTMTLYPAKENTGIIFKRTDIKDAPSLKALYTNVVDTRNCTCLGSSKENIVSTIEHLMAVLCVLGIDNAYIEINNAETPILDGSGKVFLESLQKIELEEQSSPKKFLKVIKEINYTDENGASITLLPSDKFEISFDIDFPSPIVGHQNFTNEISKEIFKQQIAPCRTFCEKYQVDYLKSIGLIKGGSLENAVVLDGDKILNKEGFRVPNECVNHKVMDTIGDLYTSGYYILAKVVANKTGHRHNNEVLKVLFDSKDNYEIV
ncbi:MAG: UDP-3-O-[3-hydroxymyristoyl] N-acetylglucosamine deacetylase [Alphaproteobacteria bacterium]|nr:UDP-3-O-[3-hydroxymyristoyl] N-acetylglucosamine deacetylase [Alphaproteobacteria bacterium]